MQSQLIRVRTRTEAPLHIAICADDDQKIFALMNVTAFTAGTYFESAEKALRECIDVINKIVGYKKDGDRIEGLHTDPGGAFLTNEEVSRILLSHHPDRDSA